MQDETVTCLLFHEEGRRLEMPVAEPEVSATTGSEYAVSGNYEAGSLLMEVVESIQKVPVVTTQNPQDFLISILVNEVHKTSAKTHQQFVLRDVEQRGRDIDYFGNIGLRVHVVDPESGNSNVGINKDLIPRFLAVTLPDEVSNSF